MIREAIGAALVLAVPAAAQTQAQMTAQAGTDWARADAAMNAQYRITMAFMRTMDRLPDIGVTKEPGYSDALLASQRAWLALRDTECVIEGYRFRGGSAQRMEEYACRATLTRQRTTQLKDMVWQQ